MAAATLTRSALEVKLKIAAATPRLPALKGRALAEEEAAAKPSVMCYRPNGAATWPLKRKKPIFLHNPESPTLDSMTLLFIS